MNFGFDFLFCVYWLNFLIKCIISWKFWKSCNLESTSFGEENLLYCVSVNKFVCMISMVLNFFLLFFPSCYFRYKTLSLVGWGFFMLKCFVSINKVFSLSVS